MGELQLINEMDNFTTEELEIIQLKANELRLKKLENQTIGLYSDLAKIISQNKGFSIELDKVKDENKEIKKDNEDLKKKVFVLRNDQDGKYLEYKKVAQTRAHKLVGKKGDVKYILFYSSFIQKLHSFVSNVLYVSNTGNIMINDCETAKGIASKWKPEKKYLREKYNEYFNKYEKGILKGEKLEAFKQYIEITDGGRNLEF